MWLLKKQFLLFAHFLIQVNEKQEIFLTNLNTNNEKEWVPCYDMSKVP